MSDAMDKYSFHPEHHQGDACCGFLESFRRSGFVHPFVRPMNFTPEKKKIDLPWFVRVNRETTSGNISQSPKNRMTIQLNYCPFCGEALLQANGS